MILVALAALSRCARFEHARDDGPFTIADPRNQRAQQLVLLFSPRICASLLINLLAHSTFFLSSSTLRKRVAQTLSSVRVLGLEACIHGFLVLLYLRIFVGGQCI